MKTKIKFTVFLLILIAVRGFPQTSESIPSSTRDFTIEKRYLNIPIKNGSKRSVTTLVDGKVHVRNDIGLADAAPDWWAFMDVSAWRGKTVTFQVDAKLPLGSTALSSIEQSEHDQRCGKHLSREAKRKSTLPKIPSRHSRTVTLTDGRGGCHTAIGKEKISVCVLSAVLFAVQ